MPDAAEPLTVPTGRFEWERIVRRIRMPKPVKLAALVLATYADPDGSRVRPGMEVLAAVTGDSERLVRKLWAAGMTDVEIATHTRLTTYTAARIRNRLGLAAHQARKVPA